MKLINLHTKVPKNSPVSKSILLLFAEAMVVVSDEFPPWGSKQKEPLDLRVALGYITER